MLIGKPEGKLLASLFWKFKSGHFVKKPWPLKREKNYYKIEFWDMIILFWRSEVFQTNVQVFKTHPEGKFLASFFGEIQAILFSKDNPTTP